MPPRLSLHPPKTRERLQHAAAGRGAGPVFHAVPCTVVLQPCTRKTTEYLSIPFRRASVACVADSRCRPGSRVTGCVSTLRHDATSRAGSLDRVGLRLPLPGGRPWPAYI